MQQFDFFLAETQINRFLAPCLSQDFYGKLGVMCVVSEASQLTGLFSIIKRETGTWFQLS